MVLKAPPHGHAAGGQVRCMTGADTARSWGQNHDRVSLRRKVFPSRFKRAASSPDCYACSPWLICRMVLYSGCLICNYWREGVNARGTSGYFREDSAVMAVAVFFCRSCDTSALTAIHAPRHFVHFSSIMLRMWIVEVARDLDCNWIRSYFFIKENFHKI